ncbi:MAG: phospholipase D-like domain-containing protein [Verrucomicrobiota bacterium]
MNDLVLNEESYQRVLTDLVPLAQKFVWIATADLKDLHVAGAARKKMVPFVQVLGRLVEEGVEVRLVHAKEPGPRFREDFDKQPGLLESDLFERVLCPRMHMKVVLVDGQTAYVGSANLTGAGIGAKSSKRRNFEAGVVTDEKEVIEGLMAFFDEFFIGDHCVQCGRRDVCPEPIV